MTKSLKTTTNTEPFATRLPAAILNAFDVNDRINRYMIENLPAEAWKERPPDGKGRTISAIVAHMHNVRVMWLKASKAEKVPDQLDRATVTPAQALKALETSRRALSDVIKNALKVMDVSGISARTLRDLSDI